MIKKIEELINEGHDVTITLKSGSDFKVNGIQEGPKSSGLGRFTFRAKPNGNTKTLIAILEDEIAAYSFNI